MLNHKYFKQCLFHVKKPSEQPEDIHPHSTVLAAGDSSSDLEGAHIQPHDPPHILNMNFTISTFDAQAPPAFALL